MYRLSHHLPTRIQTANFTRYESALSVWQQNVHNMTQTAVPCTNSIADLTAKHTCRQPFPARINMTGMAAKRTWYRQFFLVRITVIGLTLTAKRTWQTAFLRTNHHYWSDTDSKTHMADSFSSYESPLLVWHWQQNAHGRQFFLVRITVIGLTLTAKRTWHRHLVRITIIGLTLTAKRTWHRHFVRITIIGLTLIAKRTWHRHLVRITINGLTA